MGTEAETLMTLRAKTPAGRIGRARRREASRPSDDWKDKRK